MPPCPKKMPQQLPKPSDGNADDKSSTDAKTKGEDAKDATAVHVKEERKSRSRSPKAPQCKDSDATLILGDSSCCLDSDDSDHSQANK